MERQPITKLNRRDFLRLSGLFSLALYTAACGGGEPVNNLLDTQTAQAGGEIPTMTPVYISEYPIETVTPYPSEITVESPTVNALESAEVDDLFDYIATSVTFEKNGMSFQVLQQPENEPNTVYVGDQFLTQYKVAFPKVSLSGYDISVKNGIGLLAHLPDAGQYFSTLIPGDIISVQTISGSTDRYQVYGIKRFQTLSPDSPASNFIDIDDPNATVLSSYKTFREIYTSPDDEPGKQDAHLVLQTCMEYEGNPNWGRLFVLAEKLVE